VIVDEEMSADSRAAESAKPTPSLRRHIFSSGYTVALRLTVIVALKFVGVLIISRILGPANYAAYAAAFGVYMFVLAVGQAGISVYLTRRTGAPTSLHIGAATTFLLAESMAIVLLLELLAVPLGAYANIPGFSEVLRIIMLALPIQAFSMPAQALIERRLDLKGVAVVELSTLAGYYACALPLALLGVGPAALAYALVFQYLLAAPITYAIAGVRPRFAWDARFVAQMARFAVGFSAANFVLQLRSLVNPFIVGPALGAYSVGVIAMTIGILETLTQVRSMLWRITIATLTHFRSDGQKLRRIIGEGMEIQLLAIGALLLGFGWFGGLIVPAVLGVRWLPIFHVYPYIALSYLTMSTFNMHTVTLTLLNRNWLLAAFQGVNALALAAAASLFVRIFGLEGYGYAEVAALPSYWLLHYILARFRVAPNYHPTVIWWLAAAVGLFWRQLGLLAIAAPFAALLVPPSPTRIKAMALNLFRPASRPQPTNKRERIVCKTAALRSDL
jgi:PST family polysaccharide transporter